MITFLLQIGYARESLHFCLAIKLVKSLLLRWMLAIVASTETFFIFRLLVWSHSVRFSNVDPRFFLNLLLKKWFSLVYNSNSLIFIISPNSSGCQQWNLKFWDFFIAVIHWNQRRTFSTSHLPTVRFHPGRWRWRPIVSLFVQCLLCGQQRYLVSSSQQIRHFPRPEPWGVVLFLHQTKSTSPRVRCIWCSVQDTVDMLLDCRRTFVGLDRSEIYSLRYLIPFLFCFYLSLFFIFWGSVLRCISCGSFEKINLNSIGRCSPWRWSIVGKSVEKEN